MCMHWQKVNGFYTNNTITIQQHTHTQSIVYIKWIILYHENGFVWQVYSLPLSLCLCVGKVLKPMNVIALLLLLMLRLRLFFKSRDSSMCVSECEWVWFEVFQSILKYTHLGFYQCNITSTTIYVYTQCTLHNCIICMQLAVHCDCFTSIQVF